MRTRVLGLAAFIASLVAFEQNASAQSTDLFNGQRFALQQFEPAPAGDRFFSVNDGTVLGHTKGYVTLLGNYALRPLKLRDTTASEDKGYITSTQLYLHLDASFSLMDRILLNVDVPFAVAQSGDSITAGTAEVPSPKSGKLADLRLGVRVNLLGTSKDPLAVGLQGDVWLPTGDKDNLTSDGKVRILPKLVVSGNAGGLIYAVNGGFLIRNHQDLGTPEVGNAITFGAAVGVLAMDNKLQIGPEIYGNTVLPAKNDNDPTGANSDSPFLGTHSSPIEAILGAKLRLGDLVLGAGAGPGLTKAPGTPAFRALLSVGLVPTIEEAPKDRDKDGISDPMDACPDVPGVPDPDPKKNGCPPPPPPPDADKDGIPDAQDACPDKPGVPNADPTKNGCPPDRDNDGIVDTADACPDVPGVANADAAKNGCPSDQDNDGIPDAQDACPAVAGVKNDDPKKNGCPPDKDGDGVLDAVDACPDVPGVESRDPKKNGCPSLAKIEGKQIRIMEQVRFKTGKAEIESASDKLLNDVAAILKDNPEIDSLRIEGHTDNKGAKGANQVLSQKRAEAVQAWLVKKGGVDKKRLTAKGFGQDKPLADNATDEGRTINRRVEFHIGDKTEAPATKTGPKAPPAKAPAKAPAKK
jgi:outer membrane protein OmpA-like peptidoglycan-associated protein